MNPTQTQGKEKRRENLSWLLEQSRELKLDLIQNHLSLSQLMLNEIFEEEVLEKAGEKYRSLEQ